MLYSIYLTHRDPAAWENPDRFTPERFSRGRKQPPLAYVPFGGGPRACMGAAFGMAEARLVLARVMQTFRFQLVNQNVHAHMGATLEPRPGVLCRFNRWHLAEDTDDLLRLFTRFLVIPLIALLLITGWEKHQGILSSRNVRIAIGLHVLLAVVYTTPWDNYLVATNVWSYNRLLVSGVVLGWVPIEEYLFFVLETMLTGLWWWYLAGRLT